MKKNRTIYLSLLLFHLIVSCGEGKKTAPATEGERTVAAKVVKLDQLQKTDFLLTPRHGISADRNAIYSSTFLYAWNEVKKKLMGKPVTDSANFDLFSLNESPYYINSVDPKEMEIKTEVTGNGDEGMIQIHVAHQKSLPFAQKMIRFDHPMDFMGTPVQAFGLANNEARMNEMAEILYYNNDHEFALTLYPEDTAYEIMLYKPARADFKYLKDVILDLNEKIETGNKILGKNQNDWRYAFFEKDLMAIPVISFNLEHHYPSLEKLHFMTDQKKGYTVAEAYQHTAFTLDEKGAEITGESGMTIPADSVVVPKSFVFDGPFLVLVTWHHERPFLAAWITNAELMERMNKRPGL